MDKFKAYLAYFIARCKEPSTLTAIAVVCSLVGLHVDAVALQAVFTVATLVFSGLGAAVKG